MTYSKIVTVGCPGCGAPVEIAADMLEQALECGDCRTPIPIESYPELVQLRTVLRERAKERRRHDKERKRHEKQREREERGHHEHIEPEAARTEPDLPAQRPAPVRDARPEPAPRVVPDSQDEVSDRKVTLGLVTWPALGLTITLSVMLGVFLGLLLFYYTMASIMPELEAESAANVQEEFPSDPKWWLGP